jgi:hypothetical protein
MLANARRLAMFYWIKAILVWCAFLVWTSLLVAFVMCYKKNGDCTLFANILNRLMHLGPFEKPAFVGVTSAGSVFMLSAFFETMLEILCLSLNAVWQLIIWPITSPRGSLRTGTRGG